MAYSFVETVRPTTFFVAGQLADVECILLSDGTGVVADTLPSATCFNPAGTAVTGAVTAGPSAGIYIFSFTPIVSGVHEVRLNAVVTGKTVSATTVCNIYEPISVVSLAETRQHLRISNYDNDGKIFKAIAAAVDKCEDFTGRAWRKSVNVEKYQTRVGNNCIALNKSPINSIASITVSGTTISNYSFSSTSAVVEFSDNFDGTYPVVVTYSTGPLNGVVPSAIRDGILEVVAAYFERQRGGSNLPRQEEFGPSPWALPLTVTNSYHTGLWDQYRRPRFG